LQGALRWLITVIFPHFSVRHITWSLEGSRDGAWDLKFTKLTTNMLARGLFHKTLFPPSLVSCLGHRLFLPLKTGINSTILQFHKPLLTTSIHIYWHGIASLLISGMPSCMCKGWSANWRSYFACRMHTKNSLSKKLISQKLICLPYVFSAKNRTAKVECIILCKIVIKKNWNGIPSTSKF